MTKDEFLYDHDYPLIMDLVSRERYNYEEQPSTNEEVFKAGDIL